ncbi:hypothetical protein K443DRAFT_110410 [Laccaria amethystina LaAM-08-1]|uniref:Uncharacterized protein n=1 Tax=Laccaria amethystina LaAM-08-1 TaxID=1095629 RepID=A0A0C9XE77_9AGAR|nr:hypothetical protein K443DRAFT_110410 [Laccaria amethystina LaAM-08-1]
MASLHDRGSQGCWVIPTNCPESPAAEEAVIDAEENVEDDGQVAHDDTVVHSIHDAVQKMASRGVTITAEEEMKALKHFPVVSLDRCVTIHWNSDFDCLAAHLHFRNIIQSLTGVSENKLKAYRLSDELWDLAEDVQEVLLV